MKLSNHIFIRRYFFILFPVLLMGQFVPPSKPNFDELEKMEGSKIHLDPSFVQSCADMAGYYKDPTRNPKLSKTLVLSGINYSYRDFYHNFKCYTDRLGIKFLPISLDEKVHKYIASNQVSPTYLMPELPGRGKVTAEASGFGGNNFNLIGCRKLEAVAGALKLGYDVVFSDVDIALLHDPIDYLFFPGVDYVHSENNGCLRKWKFNDTMEGNTGFYSVRSNAKTIRTWELAYRSCSLDARYDDQTIFWLILRTNLNPIAEPIPISCPTMYTPRNTSAIVSCSLNNCMFSASNLRESHLYQKLVKHLTKVVQPAVMVHANWMNGKDKKKAALRRAGLWIAMKSESNSGEQTEVTREETRQLRTANKGKSDPRSHSDKGKRSVGSMKRDKMSRINAVDRHLPSHPSDWTCVSPSGELAKIANPNPL